VATPDRSPELIEQPHGGAITSPWRKGVSGNPKGRPKGVSRLERQIARALNKRLEDGRTLRQAGAELLAKDWADGDPKAREIIVKLDKPETSVHVNVGTRSEIHVHDEQHVSEAVDVIFEVFGRDDDDSAEE
jgi:hypothetical protein